MTRDPARIDPILADLRRYWHAAPDLRLGQMVMGLLDLSGAPRYGEFHAEDDKVAAYLAAWAAANPPPPDHRDALPPEIESWLGGIVSRAMHGRADSRDVLSAADTLRAAIAADKAALDATWRAHDLERDAEVAQAQAATHEACAALQAICDALHVTPPTGSTYCTEAVAMVVERVAADKARAVEAATAELRADLATAHEAIGQAQVEIVRLSSPVPQFRDAPPSPEFTEDLREAAAAARLAAHGIDAGAELVKFTAEHYNRLADAEGPFTTTDATSMREWMAQWPLSADVLPTARITLVRLLRAVEGMRQVLSQADAERLVDAFDESTFDRSNPARAALLAALTGEVAP